MVRMLDVMGGVRFWQIVMMFSWAGWVNRERIKVIDYLKDENQTLRELITKQRIRLSLEDRRRSHSTRCLPRHSFSDGRSWLAIHSNSVMDATLPALSVCIVLIGNRPVNKLIGVHGDVLLEACSACVCLLRLGIKPRNVTS